MLLRAVKRIAAKPFEHHTYAVREGLARGLKRRGGLGFLARERELSIEERFLDAIPLAGRTVYDVGCLEGMYTLFFARAVGRRGRVIAFEPNPANHEAVVRHVALNHFTNVRVYDVGLGANSQDAELAVPFGLPGQGTAHTDLKDAYLRRPGTMRVAIRVRALDEMVASEQLPAPNLIKIDVEGYEVPVLQGAQHTLRTHRPALFIELHGLQDADRVENVGEILELLERAGYPAPLHVESGEAVRDARTRFTEGHLWVC